MTACHRHMAIRPRAEAAPNTDTKPRADDCMTAALQVEQLAKHRSLSTVKGKQISLNSCQPPTHTFRERDSHSLECTGCLRKHRYINEAG